MAFACSGAIIWAGLILGVDEDGDDVTTLVVTGIERAKRTPNPRPAVNPSRALRKYAETC